MSSSKTARRGALIAAILASAVATLPIASQAAATTSSAKSKNVVASTGRATHVLATSALLNATITPNGSPTSYYFQYGTTTSYGSQTPSVNVGSGTSKIKVGKAVSGLLSGVTYHYRVVAVTATGGSFPGKDRTFTVGKHRLKFEMPKTAEVVVGVPFALSGTLGGLGNGAHAIALQASTFPYREAFKTISAPAVTDATGHFTFSVPPILASTEYRVTTLDPRPLYSKTETVHAAAKVTLHVRSSKVRGFVRLYGTVAPAAVGAPIIFQVHEAVKPGAGKPGSQVTAKFVDQFTTVVKKGGKTFARFSAIVKVRVGGRYRAGVKLPRAGAVVSGYSPTVVLEAAPNADRKSTKKKKS